MKTKEVTITVKELKSKRDIKFTDLLRLREVIDGVPDEELDLEFLSFRILDIFYGIRRRDARMLKPEQIELLINNFNTAMAEETSFNNVLIKDGIEYGFIPNFSEQLTAGELIDLDTLLKEKDYISILSILYRPIIGTFNGKGEYRIEEYKGYDDKFKDVSAFDVEGVMNLFYQSFQNLSHIMGVSIKLENWMKMENPLMLMTKVTE